MLLRDAIVIPEHVSASDFVLKLDSGVEHASVTIGEYVVTDKLAGAFSTALDSLTSALSTGGDRGSFVHGSFGSGKSHFMAILHLLIAGNASARALPGLQSAVSSHEAALATSVLTLDFHLIGASSFEDALFSGYLRQVSALHPGEALPMLHNSDALFVDAIAMRGRLGDQAFFEGLNAGGDSAWGFFGGGWDEASFDAAVIAPMSDESRNRLATALVTAYFNSYVQAGQWVGIEEGLKLITAHAKSLGYSAIALFLDELVLWLASHLADSQFVATEGSKVAKLVETGAGSRALPIISFVARQRDLKDFLGDSVPGAERVAVGQTFSWWEDRFDTIKLEASDLPEIAHRRLLQPSSSEGATALASALAQVKTNSRAWDALLTDENGADEAAFAKVYPFSPALVDTLVALSGLLQRERTALKVMAQLLSRGRDHLKVTDVLPVGDLYDVMVEGGDTPLTDEMRTHFQIARDLYREKLRPLLLATHGLTEAEITGSKAGALAVGAAPAVQAFFIDDRLAKTLLVAALAPGAPALRNMTAGRLAFLNHGTVPSIIPGMEASSVLTRVRAWAEQVGELQIGDGDDPLISLAISGVNYDSVLDQVRSEDTDAARRSLLRKLVFEQLGITSAETLLSANPHPVVWRGGKRTVDMVFGNVRDADVLPDDALRANGENWKLVIDYPFDSADHGPNDDIARIDNLRGQGVASRTVAWIPSFFSVSRQRDLGMLVLLEFLLAGSGDAFASYSANLPVEHRQLAKAALNNRRTSLRAGLGEVIKQAYGAARQEAKDIDTSYGQIPPFATLDPGLNLQPLVGATLGDAMGNLIDQMLTSQFPEHPKFEPSDLEVKQAELNTLLDHVTRARAAGGRLDGVDTTKRAGLRRIANPLRVGEMLENHYIFDASNFPWRNTFIAAASTENLTTVPMSRIRAWLAPFGLDRKVENLLAMCWALLDDKQWAKSGGTVQVTSVEQVTDDLVLRQPELPEPSSWDSARERAAALFGVTVSQYLTAANVAFMSDGVRRRAGELANACADLAALLNEHAPQLGIDASAPRMQSAFLGEELTKKLKVENNDVVLVQALAEFPVPTEVQPLAKSMTSASTVSAGMRGLVWSMIDALRALGTEDERHAQASTVLSTLAQAASMDEMHKSLTPALTDAVDMAAVLLAGLVTPPPLPPVPPVGPDGRVPEPEALGRRTVDDIHLDGIDEIFTAELNAAKDSLRQNPGKRLHLSWWIE